MRITKTPTTMQLSEHFSLSEFHRKGETPDDITVGHLRLLCVLLLEPLRVAWGSGITPTSGYRSPERNATIKGASKTSAHPLGYAADIVPTNGKMAEFKKFVKAWLCQYEYDHGITAPFDQCIDERNAAGAEWMHLGLLNGRGEMRQQFLKTTDGVHYYPDKV